MTLHPCFQPASLTPHPAPLQNLALRSGLEVEESHRPGDSVEELSGAEDTEAVRGDLTTELHLHWWLTCNNYSNRIQSLARRSQPGQPSPPTWRNASCARWCSSTLGGSWSMDQADQRRGTLEQLILPSSFRPDVSKEARDYISSCERCTAVPCFRKKEGDMMIDMVVR